MAIFSKKKKNSMWNVAINKTPAQTWGKKKVKKEHKLIRTQRREGCNNNKIYKPES